MAYRLEFPPGTTLINVNSREHYRTRAKVTKSLRAMGCSLARAQRIPRLERARVKAFYFPPDRRRRDSSNVLFLSVKACLDGCTDAGIWADDNDKVVAGIELVPGDHIVRGGQMVVIIEEVSG